MRFIIITLRKGLKNVKKINKIFALGDSLINGYGLKEEETWRYLLSESLGIEIVNASVNGSTSLDGIKRLNEYQKDIKESELVIMNFGTNDVFIDQDKNGFVSYDEHIKHMKYLIEYFQDKKIIIISVHHIIAEKDKEYFYARHDYKQYLESSPNHSLKIYNEKLKSLAKANNVYYLDLFNDENMRNNRDFLLNIDNFSLDDGVHYSNEGAQYVAKKLEKIIKEEII